MDIHLTKGNSRNLYVEGLPEDAELEVFISATNDDAATAVHEDLVADISYGVFTIEPDGRKPARIGVTCHCARFSGAAIADHADATTPYVIFRAAPDLNEFANLIVHDAKPVAAQS